MNAITIFLIAFGCIFNCCAVAYILLHSRQRDLQTKRFQKNLEEIDYHLNHRRTEE